MDALITVDATVLALIAVGIALITAVVAITLSFRQSKLLKRYRQLLNGPTGHDLEQLLLAHATDIEGLRSNLTTLGQHLDQLTADARLHVQKTAIVRFNAFPDTGSDLSFAIAMLNANNNGFVISSLYGRNESRVYAKPIQDGKSTYTLSEEEKESIAKAIGASR